MEEINLKELFDYFKKFSLHFVIIATTIFAAASFFIFFVQRPEYKSQASIILSSDQTSTITQNEVLTNKNLIDTYTKVATSHRVLDKVKQKLKLDISYTQLSQKINVANLKDTEIIEISAKDAEPKTAQKITNATANVFVKEISALYGVKNVNLLDHAVIPTTPHNINIPKQELISLAAALLIASMTIFVKFYFDRTIKTVEQIEQYIKLPFVGKVRKHITPKNTKKAKKPTSTKRALILQKTKELVVNTDPKSRISEDFRTLRTNLHFSLDGKTNKIALITSVSPSEGKSFVSSNLAATFAKTNKKVLLIDCDMRAGCQHEIFGISNEKGLSNLLADHAHTRYPSYIQATKTANLFIMPRGATPPNPSELLDSRDMESLLGKVRTKYDYIILDGTPIEDLSDSIIMAKKAERTIIVCGSGETTIENLSEAKKSLQNVEADIAGVILNKVAEKIHKNKYNKYYL